MIESVVTPHDEACLARLGLSVGQEVPFRRGKRVDVGTVLGPVDPTGEVVTLRTEGERVGVSALVRRVDGEWVDALCS